MPLIEYSCSVAGDHESLLSATSSSAAKILGKPESVMMVRMQTSEGYFGGSPDPSCRIVVRQIGAFSATAREELAHVLTWLASEHLGVIEQRVFVLFEPLAADHWSSEGRLYG